MFLQRLRMESKRLSSRPGDGYGDGDGDGEGDGEGDGDGDGQCSTHHPLPTHTSRLIYSSAGVSALSDLAPTFPSSPPPLAAAAAAAAAAPPSKKQKA